MTIFFQDKSDYDTTDGLDPGMVGGTHKVTEGTTTVHISYGRRLNLWMSQEYPILGAYHVLRTPGNGGNGSLQAQLNYWFSHMDSATPWWRTYPGFLLQIDGERWSSYDLVSADTIRAFASLLVDQAPKTCFPITYASEGQYGDSLTGIRTRLWNANYGSNNGVYPGDGSTGWTGYSGQTPVFLQYTSNPHDKNAFPGSLQELQLLIGATMTDPLTPVEQGQLLNADRWSYAVATLQRTVQTAWGDNPAVMRDTPVPAAAVLDDLRQVLAGKPDDPAKPIPLLDLLNRILAAVTTPAQLTLTADQLQALESALVAGVVAHHDALTADDEPIIRAAVGTVLRSVSVQ